MLNLTGMSEVAGIGERWSNRAIGMQCSVPATVVEVEMGVEDVGNLSRRDARGGQGCGQKSLILVYLLHFQRLLVANPGLDQDDVPTGTDDAGVEAKSNAVLVVGGNTLLPEHLRNDAEHRSAVQQVGAVGAKGQFEISKSKATADELIRHDPSILLEDTPSCQTGSLRDSDTPAMRCGPTTVSTESAPVGRHKVLRATDGSILPGTGRQNGTKMPQTWFASTVALWMSACAELRKSAGDCARSFTVSWACVWMIAGFTASEGARLAT
jgi:hypothetical protein